MTDAERKAHKEYHEAARELGLLTVRLDNLVWRIEELNKQKAEVLTEMARAEAVIQHCEASLRAAIRLAVSDVVVEA